MRNIWHILADILFPRICSVCNISLNTGEKFLCTSCIVNFPFTENLYDSPLYTSPNQNEVNYVKNIYTLFYYNKYSPYKNLIYDIKYASKKELGFYLGCMLGEKIDKNKNFDVIIPIPLHKKRQKQRGFNQAEYIARGISKVLSIPIDNKLLIRTIDNRSQTRLSAEERNVNTQNIFDLQNKESTEGKHILIVDDIITTGATMNACIKTLLAIKNVKISVACLGRTS